MAAPVLDKQVHVSSAASGGSGNSGGNVSADYWLNPRSPGSLKAQALNTIKASYAPAFSSLNQQGKRASALSAKRTADNKFYQSWLDSQMAKLQSENDAAHQKLVGFEQGLSNQQNALYAGQPGTLESQANARAGNVSNNAQSSAFGDELHQNQAANTGLLNQAEQQTTKNMDISNTSIASTRANNYGIVAASQSKQLSDLQSILGKISDERMKLGFAEKGDIAKEIARLQGVEIQKAQSTRSYNAAIQKLNITAANTASQIATRKAQLGINQQNANTSSTKASNAQMNADRTFQLNSSKYGLEVAKYAWSITHGGSASGLGTAGVNSLRGKITTLQGRLRQLTSGAGLSPGQAWQALHLGYYNHLVKGKYVKVPVTPAGDDGLLNAAYNTSVGGGGGLSGGDIKFLQKLGWTNPSL